MKKETHQGHIYDYCGSLHSILISETLALNQVGKVLGFFPYQVASILY